MRALGGCMASGTCARVALRRHAAVWPSCHPLRRRASPTSTRARPSISTSATASAAPTTSTRAIWPGTWASTSRAIPASFPKNMEGAGSLRLANWLYNVGAEGWHHVRHHRPRHRIRHSARQQGRAVRRHQVHLDRQRQQRGQHLRRLAHQRHRQVRGHAGEAADRRRHQHVRRHRSVPPDHQRRARRPR